MSIQSQINRIAQNVSDSLDAVANKGVTVPAGSNSDDLPGLISNIQTNVIENVYQDENGFLVLDDDEGYSISAIPLTVNQNGTYTAPARTAYSPVTVNVASGGGASKKQVNFIDYDGTLLHSYTKTELNALEALPSNPSHTGLVAQGWNWTLAQIKSQLLTQPNADVWVGQMYITQSGNTEIDVSMPYGRLSPILTICVNGTITVDWGDNTTADTVTGSSITTRKEVSHTYASAGNYTIVIHVVSGSFQFEGSGHYLILRKNATGSENRVYSNCVKNVRFGNGVTSIGSYAFYDCYSLTSITIPSGVTSIGSYAFYHCYSLTSITIPSGVTSIGSYAFDYCYSLASITIPSGVTSIVSYAFANCNSLTSITIPSGVTSIGSYAFYNCYSLTSITIPSEVTNIESYAFAYCNSLASITIPSGVTSIGGNAFAYCYSLASITILSGVTSIETYAFYFCYSLESITIPSGVTRIKSYAFANCYSLTSITIPSEVTNIESYAFSNCYSLASITIPSGVTSIGGNAFASCSGMAEYHVLPTDVPTLGTNVFSSIASDCSIYVPSTKLTDYQSATNWSTYASYMQGE